MLLWSSVTAFSQEIWQLSPWAPDSSYVISAMSSGEPTWVKVDSLGVADSIYISGDSIRLRDGAGVAQLPTASTSTKGLLSSTDWNIFNDKVGGSGVATRVPFWSGTSTLSSTANLLWVNAPSRLEMGPEGGVNIGTLSGTGTQGVSNVNIGYYNGNILGPSNIRNVSIGTENFWLSGSSASGNVNIGKSNYIYGHGHYNINIGESVNRGNPSTGSGNVYLGQGIANAAGAHYQNVGLGYYALNVITNGHSNVANGSYSLKSLTTGVENVGLGFFGGGGITTQNSNLALGAYALGISNGGNSNVGIGSYAAANNTGYEIVAIGGSSGRFQGHRTVAIGAWAGGGVGAVGNSNIFIGWSAGNSESGSNRLHITNSNTTANGIFGDFANSRFGINQAPSALTRTFDINGELRIRDVVTTTPTKLMSIDNDGVVSSLGISGLSISGGNLVSSAGSTEYIDPYIISSDTVGFILKNVMDTVQFIGVAGVIGESTTVSDSPTINMTLTGTNITGEIVDGSVTPAKLSQAYLTSEVDGSTTNEIQTLSISGSDLTISGAGGNTVTLPSGGGSSEWASLHYGSLAANTQTLTSSVWNTINFTGSSESNASVIDANHTNDEIEFVVAGTYRVDYRVSFIANADALIYSGIYSSASSSVDGNTQMESDTDSGYKHTIMQHSYIKTAVAGEKIKLQVQPLIAHTSVAIYSNFIVTKL